VSEEGLLARTSSIDVRITSTVTEADVRICGELDIVDASRLGRVLRMIVEDGHRSVALHLVGLTFMDVSGLHVIEDIAGRLQRSRRRLTLHCVTNGVRRLLEITEIDQLLVL
jgi:anti-anti-sigma factor